MTINVPGRLRLMPIIHLSLLALLIPLQQACQADVVAGGGEEQLVAKDTTTIRVNAAVTYQSVDGFGATTLPLVYPTGDYLGQYRAAAIEAAFGDVGITLGPLSTGIVETPANATQLWEERGNDNADPFSIAPDRFNFSGSDVIRAKIINPAKQYGYDNLALGPIIDLRGRLAWMRDIRDIDYDRYLDEAAEHVLAVMQHWKNAYGVVPPLLHLFNEPTSGNDELKTESTQEVVDLVKRIGQRLSAAGFKETKFIVPNEATISRSYEVAQALLTDPEARPYVGVIGYHPYPYGSTYASPSQILETSGIGAAKPGLIESLGKLKALSERYDVPVWMTEVSEGPGTTDYPFTAIENVLARAIHIHDNFYYAGASAFYGMNAIWDSRSHAEHFAGRDVDFLDEQSDIVLADVGTGKIYISGMGYAIGQYARWVKKGDIVALASSDNPRVIATAFRNRSGDQITVVAVNNTASAQALKIVLSGASANGSVKGEESYEQERWASIQAFSPASSSEIHYTAPAKSVVTLTIPVGGTTKVSIEDEPLASPLEGIEVHPNPFRSQANIHFSLSHDANVSLRVFDALGRQVAILANGFMDAGSHELAFQPRSLESGVYFFQLVADRHVRSGKLVLLN
ncbi:MAG TPA: T9SS type A sorting domain-containing protein [Rhodothermales bacterium]|nr:T9SS type A sorting domain-containing protein [Rhodothermales bacterium]